MTRAERRAVLAAIAEWEPVGLSVELLPADCHWRVIREATRDGEPAVQLVCITARKASCVVIVRLMMRTAIETNPATYEEE